MGWTLVLLQEEVNPVLVRVVTTYRRHRTPQPFFWDYPHVYYMHVQGMGKAAYLARRVRPGPRPNRTVLAT